MNNFPKANTNRKHTNGTLTDVMLQSYKIVELNAMHEDLSMLLKKITLLTHSINEKTLDIAKLNHNFLDIKGDRRN